MRKVISVFITAFLLFTLPGTSVAIENQTQSLKSASSLDQTILQFYIGSTVYYVNDEQKSLDVPPFIKESRTLVPVRFVAEALGGTVSWDQGKQEVGIDLQGTIIKLWIGKATAEVNGAGIPIDSANPKVVPIIEKSRTFIPLRFVLEALSAEVVWQPDDKGIAVRFPKPALIAYENSDYKISYPQNWSKTVGSITMFISPEGESVNIVYEDLSSQPVTLADYTDLNIDLLSLLYPDIVMLESASTTLAGNPAHRIVYTITAEDQALKLMQVLTIKDTKAYVITYLATPGTYSNYSATVQEMIGLFEIK